MDLRRIALGGLVALPLTVGGGIAAGYLFGPQLVRGKLQSLARERLGLEAEVGDVRMGFGSIELENVVLGGSAESGVRTTCDRVTVQGSPWIAAIRGPRHFESIVLRGVASQVRVQSAAFAALRERLSSERSANRSRGSEALPRPQLRVDGLTLEVFDETGPLLTVAGGGGLLEGDGVSFEAERVEVGAPDTSRISARGLSGTLTRSGEGWRVEKTQVAGADVVHVREVRAETSGPADGAEGRVGDEGDGADEADEGTEGDGSEPRAPSMPKDEAPMGLRARFMRALRRGEAASESAGAAATGPSGHGAVFAPEFSGTLGSTRVRDASGTLLEELTAAVSVVEGDALRLRGQGRGARGGTLHWNFRLWPAELRADGELRVNSLPLSLVAPILPQVPWHEAERATVDARIVVTAQNADSLGLTGDAQLHDVAISSDRVAPVPVSGIDLSVQGQGHWVPSRRRLEVDEGSLQVGDAKVGLKGAVGLAKDHYLFAVDAQLPPTPCTSAIRALPGGLLADLAQTEFSGTLGGKLHLRVDSRDLGETELDFEVADRCQFVAVPQMADLRRFKMPFVHSVVEPDGSVFEMDTGPGTSSWTFLEDVSPFLVHAVLAHEDAQFFSHQGFAPAHIRNALVRNLREGRYAVGASTITMQLVKNIFLHREKTLARKIQEVILTWWIERVMDKHEILELYLNVIEYGPGVYGIRDGARHYFNRLPSELSPAESIYLSTILPNPKRYHLAFERGSVSPAWVERMRKILKRMKERGWYDDEAVAYANQELTNFHFVPEGTVTERRQGLGSTSPLPYMQHFGLEWDGEPAESWDDEPAPAQFAP